MFATEADNLLWAPGTIQNEHIRLRTRDLPRGEYELRMRMLCGKQVVRIGMAPERCEDGWYLLSDVRIQA